MTETQRELCDRFGVPFTEAEAGKFVAISDECGTGLYPINGLRHPITERTTGWYLWAGEVFKSNHDFFKPSHCLHLAERCPEVLKYLGLPPGWRFLIAPGYEDVWFDEALLNV